MSYIINLVFLFFSYYFVPYVFVWFNQKPYRFICSVNEKKNCPVFSPIKLNWIISSPYIFAPDCCLDDLYQSRLYEPGGKWFSKSPLTNLEPFYCLHKQSRYLQATLNQGAVPINKETRQKQDETGHPAATKARFQAANGKKKGTEIFRAWDYRNLQPYLYGTRENWLNVF